VCDLTLQGFTTPGEVEKGPGLVRMTACGV